MALIGYARVSTIDQNLGRQLDALHEAGVDDNRIFTDKFTGTTSEREGLQSMLNYIRDDDTVVVMSIDRLSRNYEDVGTIIGQIKEAGAGLRILDMPDFSQLPSPFDQMMTNILIQIYSGIAENERQKMLERQRGGIAVAKREGKYAGGVVQYSAESTDPKRRVIYNTIVSMLNDGVSMRAIERETGVTRPTIRRIKTELNS